MESSGADRDYDPLPPRYYEEKRDWERYREEDEEDEEE